jgi:hypothetical protein
MQFIRLHSGVPVFHSGVPGVALHRVTVTCRAAAQGCRTKGANTKSNLMYPNVLIRERIAVSSRDTSIRDMFTVIPHL